jgi:hippurate hydrolase
LSFVSQPAGLPYASTKRAVNNDGNEVAVMHACGHDAHTTWMLGLAKAMVALKSDWKGTLILVGQPAEEGVAGARAMVEDGLYTRHGVPVPDYLLGMHSAPGPTGFINPNFQVDLNAIPFGTKVASVMTMELMQK